MKVLIICNFSNGDVRSHLPLDNRRLYIIARRMLSLPVKSVQYGDYGPWCTALIHELGCRKDIDLFVITAHQGLRRSSCAFEINGVHYFFLRADYATLLRHIIPSSKWWQHLNLLNRAVRRIVDNIKPDIINLIGAENGHIASTVLGLERRYPVLVTCQTIYNNPERTKYGEMDAKSAYVERLVFNRMKYFGIADDVIYRLSGQLNPSRIPLRVKFPVSELPKVEPVEKKEYDFVNFALTMTPKKGFTDALEALAIVKKKYPHVTLNLVGNCDNKQKEALDAIINHHGLNENVTFTPFFPDMKDLLQHIQKSRFALLPCKLDYISGTTRQSMYYGIPTVAYVTEGTPSLNKEKECLLLAKNSDVEDLASKMLMLLEKPELATTLRNNSMELARRLMDNKMVADNLLLTYSAIIEHYSKDTTIPNVLLWK